MHKLFSGCILAAVSSFTGPAYSTARPRPIAVAVCPITMTSNDADGTGSTPTTLLLRTVALYDGPPAEHAMLAPGMDNQQGKYVRESWVELAPNVKGTWLECRYGPGQAHRTELRLDRRVKRCDVTFQKPGRVVERVTAIACTR